MTRGRFVVLEGGDGSGKSTQTARLAQTLRTRDLEVVQTFEPGAGSVGEVIRNLVLHGPDAIEPLTEALLMAADRAQHVATEIAPALDRGAWVVCDRFVPSSLVYQGVVRALGVDVVQELNAVATAGLTPDVVVVLDVPDDVATSRRGDSLVGGMGGDRLERESQTFHASVRQAYRDLAPRLDWTVVDGAGPVEEVAQRVEAAVAPLLG